MQLHTRWIGRLISFSVFVTTLVGVGEASDRLLPDQRLTATSSLVSQNGLYDLEMQGDGNLVLYSRFNSRDWRPIWSTVTQGSGPKCFAIAQNDGNFVVYNKDSKPLWASGTVGSGPVTLVVENSGCLTAYNSVWRPVWTTGDRLLVKESLLSGNRIISKFAKFDLEMQSNGNLVLYAGLATGWNPVWSTKTENAGPDSYLYLAPNGELKLIDSRGKTWWTNRAGGKGGVELVLRDSGELCELDRQGNVIWSSSTKYSIGGDRYCSFQLSRSANGNYKAELFFANPDRVVEAYVGDKSRINEVLPLGIRGTSPETKIKLGLIGPINGANKMVWQQFVFPKATGNPGTPCTFNIRYGWLENPSSGSIPPPLMNHYFESILP